MVDFTVDPYNVENGGETYSQFIARLRELVAVRHSHNRAVTLVEENPPTRFFDMVLQTNNAEIRVRFRRDNLYLVGYQMQGSNEWLELRYDNNTSPPRIPNSTDLTFGDTYAELLRAASVPHLTNIRVGRPELVIAVRNLATSTNRSDRARALIVVIIMIIESARFDRITTHFATLMHLSEPIPDWVESYVRGWGDLSAALLHHDADNSFRLPARNNFGNIRSFVEAAALIGIMKGYFFGRGQRILLDYPQGRPLVELFDVTIDYIHGNRETYCDIYGKIQIRDGLGDEYVYDLDVLDSELSHTGNAISLNGPARCTTAYDSFTIHVTLMDRVAFGEDDEISKGNILWEVTNISTNQYDKLLSQEVEGRFGLATLRYAVLSDAVQALVEVTLINIMGGDDTARISGTITSHNVNLNSESVLFHRKSTKPISVDFLGYILLSKWVVAVPLNSNFIIRADLKNKKIFSSDEEIALGIATFHPQLSGTDEKNISGKQGQIQVKVTWDWYVGS